MIRRPPPVLLALTATLLLADASVRLHHPTPAAASPNQKQQGAELFATRGCAHCHGDTGQGTDRAPNLRAHRLPKDHIRDQILHGGQGMPAFGDSLNPAEVNALIALLRSKSWPTPPPSNPKIPAS